MWGAFNFFPWSGVNNSQEQILRWMSWGGLESSTLLLLEGWLWRTKLLQEEYSIHIQYCTWAILALESRSYMVISGRFLRIKMVNSHLIILIELRNGLWEIGCPANVAYHPAPSTGLHTNFSSLTCVSLARLVKGDICDWFKLPYGVFLCLHTWNSCPAQGLR